MKALALRNMCNCSLAIYVSARHLCHLCSTLPTICRTPATVVGSPQVANVKSKEPVDRRIGSVHGFGARAPDPKSFPPWIPARPRIDAKVTLNRRRSDPKSTAQRPHTDRESTPNRPRFDPTSTPNRRPQTDLKPTPCLDSSGPTPALMTLPIGLSASHSAVA